MTDFEIVPDEMRKLRRTVGKQAQPKWTPLWEGKTIFVPLTNGLTYHTVRNRAYGSTLRKGLRLRTFTTERDGVPGVVMWAVPKGGAE